MNKEELHQFIAESKGNESNICQICVIKGEEIVYEDCWRGFKPEDAVNVNSVTAGWGLCATGRDLAKLGSMVLNEGKYKGQQVVSSEWINQMTTPYLKLGERFGFMEYGYLWYKPIAGKEVYAAIGDCGNIIYVNKELNLTVGMTGTFKPRIFDRVEFIEKTVLDYAQQ